jgi:hypothetical protein
MSKHTTLPRRQFLVTTGVTLAAALAINPARAQLIGQPSMTRPPFKVGVAPGYIVSGRGEHSSNPFFVPQGKPSSKRMPTPRAVHGKGIIKEDAP